MKKTNTPTKKAISANKKKQLVLIRNYFSANARKIIENQRKAYKTLFVKLSFEKAIKENKKEKTQKTTYIPKHQKTTTKKSFSLKKYEHILAPYKTDKVLIYENPAYFITANFLHVPIIYASIIKLANNGNASAQNILQGYGGLCSFDDLISASTMALLQLDNDCKVIYSKQYGYTLDITDKPTRQACFAFSALLSQNRRDTTKTEYFTIISDNGNNETIVNATDRKSIIKYCEFKNGSTNHIKLIKAFWNERTEHFTLRTVTRLEKILPLWLGGYSNDKIASYVGLSKSQVDNLYTVLRKKYKEYVKENYKVKGINKRETLIASTLSALYITHDKKGKEVIKAIF